MSDEINVKTGTREDMYCNAVLDIIWMLFKKSITQRNGINYDVDLRVNGVKIMLINNYVDFLMLLKNR